MTSSHTRQVLELTPVQARAVAHAGGPLLVLGGAGSGKTTVLARRFAWLVAQRSRGAGVDPRAHAVRGRGVGAAPGRRGRARPPVRGARDPHRARVLRAAAARGGGRSGHRSVLRPGHARRAAGAAAGPDRRPAPAQSRHRRPAGRAAGGRRRSHRPPQGRLRDGGRLRGLGRRAAGRRTTPSARAPRARSSSPSSTSTTTACWRRSGRSTRASSCCAASACCATVRTCARGSPSATAICSSTSTPTSASAPRCSSSCSGPSTSS